jgi:hypothetical protein
MRLNGWKSRQMVDRYADDVANQRALEAKRRKGDMVLPYAPFKVVKGVEAPHHFRVPIRISSREVPHRLCARCRVPTLAQNTLH